MGWLSVAMGCIATYLYYRTGQTGFCIMSGLATFVALWSYGVMHNFAVEAAKNRSGYTGGFFDIEEQDLASVPNAITNVSLASSIVILVLFVLAWIL